MEPMLMLLIVGIVLIAAVGGIYFLWDSLTDSSGSSSSNSNKPPAGGGGGGGGGDTGDVLKTARADLGKELETLKQNIGIIKGHLDSLNVGTTNDEITQNIRGLITAVNVEATKTPPNKPRLATALQNLHKWLLDLKRNTESERETINKNDSTTAIVKANKLKTLTKSVKNTNDAFKTINKDNLDTAVTRTLPTGGTWQTGSWSTCNKPCGGGTQTRSVTCQTTTDSNCAGTKPATSQSCNTQACPTPPTELQFGRSTRKQYPVGKCSDDCGPNCSNSRWSIVSPFVFERWENGVEEMSGKGKFNVLRLKIRGCAQADGLSCGPNNTPCKTVCEELANGASGFSFHFTVNHDCLKFSNNVAPTEMTCGQDGSGKNVSSPTKAYIWGPDTRNNDTIRWIECGDATFAGCGSTIYSMKVHVHAQTYRWNRTLTDYFRQNGIRIALPLGMLKDTIECQNWANACKMKPLNGISPDAPCMITSYRLPQHDYCPMVPLRL
jgi:hypothetical protein